TVMGMAFSSGFLEGERSDTSTSSTPAITFLVQEALISGGLVALAHDPSFVAVTRDEMVASSQMEMDEVEKAAMALLKRRETLQGTRTGSAPQDSSAASLAGSSGLSAAPSQETITATRL
ncbi:CAC1S protein, partial [Geococcyx californianus]|nr:CAC1S protein [Geococcyx californianus]